MVISPSGFAFVAGATPIISNGILSREIEYGDGSRGIFSTPIRKIAGGCVPVIDYVLVNSLPSGVIISGTFIDNSSRPGETKIDVNGNAVQVSQAEASGLAEFVFHEAPAGTIIEIYAGDASVGRLVDPSGLTRFPISKKADCGSAFSIDFRIDAFTSTASGSLAMTAQMNVTSGIVITPLSDNFTAQQAYPSEPV